LRQDVQAETSDVFRAARLTEATPLLRALRLFRLALAMTGAFVVALCLFPICRNATRLRLKAGVARSVVNALGVRLDPDLNHAVPGALIVANHISWIDIFVINAVLPAAFVSKEEVRRWPLVGLLAARSETVFLRRGSRGHARIINQQVADILANGNYVAVFPEGTTTDGTHLLHFHAALIQPALAVGRPVLPVAISYWEADGSRSLAPGYVGDISLAQCLRTIIGRKGLVARVATCPALGLHGEDRRQVAALAREAICAGALLPNLE
jgi:1-acyl-sn-glycerol-3-phosphate acyltransferase